MTAAFKQPLPPKVTTPFIAVRYGPVPEYTGLTLPEIVVWEYLVWRKWDDGTFEGQQKELAGEVHLTENAFRRAVTALLEKGRLRCVVTRRGRGTRFVFPEAGEQLQAREGQPPNPHCQPPESDWGKHYIKTKKPVCTGEVPGEVIDLRDQWNQKISAELVDEWDRQFPQTVAGAHRSGDQQALYQLLTGTYAPEAESAGRSPEQIRAYMAFLQSSGSLPFCLRPYKLLQRVDRGRGPYKFADLEARIEVAQSRRPGKGRSWREPASVFTESPPTSSPTTPTQSALSSPALPPSDPALESIRQALQAQVSESIFRVWFAPESLALTLEGETVVCLVQTKFHAEWLESRYRDLLQQVAQRPIRLRSVEEVSHAGA